MTALREKTRRFWTSVLFIVLGPIALCLACGVLYWQRTPRAAAIAGTGFSQNLRYDVSLERNERVRPGVQRFVNVKIGSRESNEEILFCPEIYKITFSDLKLLHSFAASFDNRGRSSKDNKQDEVQGTSESDLKGQNNRRESFSDVVYDSIDQLKSYTLVVLPRVFYRSSKATEITEALTDRLRLVVANDAVNSGQASVICVVADEILLLSENDYETFCETENDVPSLRSKHELIGAFRSAIFQTPRGFVGITEDRTQNEAIAFSTEPPKLEKFRALHFNSQKFARTDVLFELSKISAPVPYYASFFRDKNEDLSRIEYDSSRCPTPGSLAAQVVPSLNFLTPRGWFAGKTTFHSVANQKNGGWTARLEDFHLHGCRVEDVCSRFSLPSFTGEVSDLTVSEGQICDGIFRGKGSVRVFGGTIPIKVVERLCSIKMLKVSPSQTMKLRFINDATPFDELDMQFSFDENGVMFDSNYSSKIIAYYENDSVRYGLFLPEEIAGKRVPYAAPITALFDSQNERSFWNPLVRNALNHLPIPETADAGTNKQFLR